MTDAACGAGIVGIGSDVSVLPPVEVGIASGRGAVNEVTVGAGGSEPVVRDGPVDPVREGGGAGPVDPVREGGGAGPTGPVGEGTSVEGSVFKYPQPVEISPKYVEFCLVHKPYPGTPADTLSS
jgi:hypothetical protein